jgi:WXG100 family type VII secretion target
MPADRLRVEYNILNNLAKSLGQESHDIEQLTERLTRAAEQLYQAGWSGRAADSFYKEAAEVAFPATSKLGTLLQEVGEVIVACLKIYYEADQQVGNLFHKEMPGAAAGKQSYDPNEGVKAFWSAFGNRWLKIGADTAKSTAMNAVLGPMGMILGGPSLGQAMAKAYKENGGGALGVLGMVNVFNPVSHLMESAYTADQELGQAFFLDKVGDHAGAMKHFTQGGEAFADTTKAAVDTGMTAAGGAKMVKGFLGEEPVPTGKGEPGEGAPSETSMHGSDESVGTKGGEEPGAPQNPTNTLIGESTSQMRRDAAKVIGETENHPLKFLLDDEGKFKPTKGLTHAELADNPDLVQMGHIVSNKSGQPERIMLQGAWENQFNAITAEKPRMGTYVENVAVDIGGVAVDIKTAKFWESIGWLPEGTVGSAPQITFFTTP